MNRKKIISLTIASVLIGSACNQGFESEGHSTVSRPNGTVTFILPDAGKSVTYTRAGIAGDDSENVIADLVAYQFDAATGVYEEYYQATTAMITANKMDINTGINYAGTKKFLFVANCGATATRLGTAALTKMSTTTTDVTGALQQITAGKLAAGSNLPMFSYDNGSAFVDVDLTSPVTAGYAVKLNRSVARIDILNYDQDYETAATDDDLVTNFTITKVEVTGANTKGYVIDNRTSPYAGAAADRTTFTINDDASLNAWNHPALNSAGNAIESHAAFYLLPTNLKAEATQIWLHGTFSGNPRIIQVKLPANVSNDTIKSNHIYRINVQKIGSKDVIANLEVQNYDASNELNSAEDKTVTCGNLFDADGNAVSGNSYTNNAASNTADTRLNFTLSTQAISPQVVFVGFGNGITLEKGTTTYVATPTPHYKTIYYIVLPHTTTTAITGRTLTVKATDAAATVLKTFTIASFTVAP